MSIIFPFTDENFPDVELSSERVRLFTEFFV